MGIVKEKNLVMVANSQNKNYVFNLSDLTIIGVMGRPIKQFPSAIFDQDLLDDSDNLLRQLIVIFAELFKEKNMHQEFKVKCISAVEKIVAVGLTPPDLYEYRREQKFYDSLKLTKDVVDFIKENNNGRIDRNSVQQFALRGLREKYTLNKKQFDSLLSMARYVSDGDYLDYYALCLGTRNIDAWHYAINLYQLYYETCQELGVKWEKTRSILEECSKVKHMLNIKKLAEKETKIKENNKLKYGFAFGDYIAIIPQTEKEIQDEGENNRNCVAGYVDNVVEGDIVLAFIRHKDQPEKSLITCSIHPHSLNIQQFLGTRNNRDIPNDLINMKHEYQKFLKSLAR